MIPVSIWAQQPGRYFCLSTRSASGSFKDHFFERNDFKDIRAFLRSHAKFDIYFCPHGFNERARRKDCAALPSLLWADLDERHPKKIKHRPTVAIESSPGRYVGLWVTDRAVTESLNKRMSYMIGSDKSGWDLTQLLRVPNTTNFKYDDEPKVRVLWRDGPTYQVAKLDREIDDLPEGEDVGTSEAASVYQKWEATLPPWARRELMATRLPAEGSRSEMVFKLANTMLELGIPRDDGVELIRASVWNKYRGRRDEDRQLGRTWDKATGKHLKGATKEAPKKEPLAFTLLSELQYQPADWLWYPYLVRGEITIVQADPGVGKSTLLAEIAGRLATGVPLPNFRSELVKPVRARVLIFDFENPHESVTKARLSWVTGNDAKNIAVCDVTFGMGIMSDRERVWDLCKTFKPDVVVFDTMMSYMESERNSDTNQADSASRVFNRFKELARDFDCSVVAVRHLTKGGRDKAMYRGTGSIAFTGLSRIEITLGRSPEDPYAVVAVASTKNSFVTERLPTMTFEAPRKNKDDINEMPRASNFNFTMDIDAEDLVAAPDREELKKQRTAEQQAEELLLDVLKEGKKTLTQVLQIAESRSISERTIRRAAERLKVVRYSEGFGKNKHAVWKLRSSFATPPARRSASRAPSQATA